ncbi:hypothetical protein [Polaribacter sp. Hel_I_88]|uniref:hypothetical protein n=1 Tax=Polaribacter sp. Hel_I_88 TaxID=1250006 RepID=UPI00047AA70F|nr:hypothetical protein [Polaribacter sp. Hel_I_88]
MKKLNFILILILIFSACNTSKKSDSKELINNLNLKIIDSIIISKPNIFFQDRIGDNLLLTNYVNSEIHIFNIRKHILSSFTKQGSAFDEYRRTIRGNLKFLNDSVLGVGNIKGIKKYNFQGDFLGNISINNKNTFAPLVNFKLYKNLLTCLRTFQGDPSKKKFYENKQQVLLTKDLNTSEENSYANFPTNESDLSNKTHYYNYIYDFYSTANDSIYSFVNSNDANIFDYNVLSGQLISHKKLDLDKYNPLSIEFGKLPSNQERFTNLFIGGAIRGYFRKDNKEIILYSEGLNKEDVISFYKENSSYDVPDPIYWISVLDKRKKTTNDFKIPKKIGSLVHMISNDKLMFRKNKNYLDEQKGITTFYYVQVIYN